MPALTVTNVSKQYGETVALHNLDLTVERGEIFGFLGPNGAGKSTTIDLLLDFCRPDSGEIRVLGHDPQESPQQVRQHLGVIPDDCAIDARLTGRQHILFALQSKQAPDDIDAILTRVGLADAGARKAGTYSKGMVQRLLLGMALVGQPELLILDEPSTGLDPNGTRELRQIVREERDRGATVFFSSHDLTQVEALCDRVGILRDGALIAVDDIAGLRDAAHAETSVRITVDHVPDNARTTLQQIDGVSRVRCEETTIHVACLDDVKTTVVTALENAGATIQDFSTETPSLEDLFAAYTTTEDPK